MRVFFHVFPSFSENLIWKMSILVSGEILGMFIDTFTGDGKYSAQDSDNFPLPIQMLLFEKLKHFSQFFLPFLELYQILNILKRKMIVIANVFLKLKTVKKIG